MASNLEDRKNFLVNIVSGSLFSEPRFSSEGDPQAKVIADLVAEVAEKDPEFILKLALYVRDDLNIRSTANFLLALATNTDGCHPFLAKYYPAIIRLPSDWLDVVALYYLLPDRKLQSRGLPTSLRKAMADRFRNFDGYQLGKYNKENSAKRKRRREKKKLLEQAGSSSSSGLFGDDEEDDAASAADEDDATKKRYPITIKQMIRQLHINEPVLQVMCVLGKKYPANEEDFRRSRLNGLFERERAGSRMKLPVPETWETLLSSLGNTAQAWEQLIDKRKLPFMAMLRNLRNILLTGVSKRHHNWVLSKLRDEKTIANSRQFPFSFFTAYEAINIKPEDLGGAPNAQELANLTPQQRAMKLKKLAKKKVFRMPAADLIERYRQALDTALKHATVHNVKPIKGRTLVICSASDVMKNTNLTGKRVGSFKSLQEIALLLGLMCKFVCEDCTFFLMDRSDSPKELQLVDGTILDNMTRAIATASSLSSGPNEFPIAFLEKATDSKSRIDNIIVLSNETFGRGANDLEAQIPGGLTMLLDKYRTEVNSELLFVSVNLNSKAAKMGDNSHPKNVSIYGFSDAILRFVAERGDGCQLEYIQTIDQEKKLDQRKKKKEDSLLSSWSSLSFSSSSSSSSSSRGSRLPGAKDAENASSVAPSSLVDPRSEQEAKWINAKVFVSSTFKDMHGERDILARHVFPELQRRCKRHRINLTYVDLRWGVTEEEASSSIEICLTQVHDAFFLGMLGERYGWAPSQYNVSSPDDPKLSWLKEYPTNRSITELEIHCGAFLGRSVKSVFCIRDPSVVSLIPENHRKDFQCDGGADVAQKLRDLKERVEQDFGHTGNVLHYGGQWGGLVDGKPILSGLEAFSSFALHSLWSQICEVHEIEDYEDEYGNDDLEDDEEFDLESHYEDLKVHHEAYAFERFKCFAGRKTVTDRIVKTLDNAVDRKGVIVVHGEPGAGKSAILAHLSSHYRKVRPHATVISHFVGSAPGSTNIRDTLHRISWEISLALRPDETPDLPVDYNEIKKAFARLLKEAEFESIVLIIDGLNQLSDAFQAHSLDWIPDEVPLPIVVSTYTDAVSHCVLRANPSSTCIAIGPLNENEQRDMVRRVLAEHYKKLDESPSNNQMRMLIKKRDASKPLYLAVACEELRLIGTYEQLNENIKRFAPSMPMLLASVMKRLEEDHERNFQHFPKLINTIFSLIICSRDGLSQKEIFESLAIKQFFLDAQSSSSSGGASRFGAKHKQQLELDQHRFKEVLTEGQWLRLLFSLGGYLRIAGETNEGAIYDFFHQVFKQTAEKRYVGAKEKATPTHKILATMFLKRADPTGDFTFVTKDARAISELPYHLLLAKMWPQLVNTLSSIHFICAKTRLGMTFGLLRDYSAVLFQEPSSSSSSGFFEQQISSSSISENDRAQIVEYYRFLLSNLTVITETPSLLLQQAANQPDDTLPAIEALKAIEAAKSNGPKHWIKWLNKPQDIDRCLVNMSGFGEPIMGCCFSPDGKFVACGSRDRVVRVFDSHSGSEICSLRGHTHWVVACAFSASNSQLLATGSWDSTVKIWDIETRSLLHTLTGHSRRVSCVAFSHDGKFVLSGSWDCSFIVWRADTGEKVFQLKGQDKPINCLAWSSDDKIVAIGLWSGDVLLFNAEKDFAPYLEPIKDAHDQSVRSVAFSPVREADPSGNRAPLLLLSSSTDGSMKVWNIDDMDAHSAILNAHSQSVNACAFSADGKHVATASDDQTIAIWDILGGTESLCFQPGKEDPFIKEKKQRKTDNNKPVSAFDFSASLSSREENVGFPTCISSFGSNLLAIAMNDCTIQLWDLKKMRRVQKFSGHQHTITSVKFIDEDTLVSSSEDNSVCIWTVGNANPVARSENHRGYANCVAVNPSSSSGSKYEIVSVSDDSSIIFYPEATIVQSIASSSGGAFVGDSKTFTQKSAVLSCALSPDSSLGTQFVVGSRDGIARVYRQRSEPLGWDSPVSIQSPLSPIAVALTLEGHRDWVTNVSYSPAGSKICTGSFDFTLAIWDSETGEKLHNLLGHTGGVIGHAWSPDSKIIASCSFDGTIRQWSAETGKLIVTIVAHSQRVTGISWTEDGKTLITSSEDGSVKIWTASSGILVTNLQGHVRPVQSLAFSPDATRVVSSSEDCSLRIWDTSEIKLDVSASKKPIVASRLSADGKFLFNAYRDGKATVHSTASGTGEGLKIVQEIKDYSLAHAADFHSDSQGNGTFVLINGYDAEMVFYDTVRDSPLAHFALSSASVVSSTRFSPQGDLLAVGQWNGNLQVFPIRRMLADSASSKKGRGGSSSSRNNAMGVSSPLCTLRHPNWVNSISFSSDNAKLLSSCHDANVRMWDINRKTTTETFRLSDCALFANFGASRAGSDTNLIVYGGTGSAINLRDTRSSSGSSPSSLSLPKSTRVFDCQANTDENLAVSVSEDRVVRLWDLRSEGQPLSMFHTTGVPRALSFVAPFISVGDSLANFYHLHLETA